MDDADALLHAELERIAAAYLAIDAADETFEAAASASAGTDCSPDTSATTNPTESDTATSTADFSEDEIGISPELSSSLLAAQRTLLRRQSETTALVSLPPWITLPPDAEYLFKLQPPFETTGKLEEGFGLEKGSAVAVTGEDEDGEKAEFVFVSGGGKEEIAEWYKTEEEGRVEGKDRGWKEKWRVPLFVRLARMGAMGRGGT